jgi:hypothetical protein
MKKILLITMLFSTMLLSSNHAKAQAWQRNSKVISLGFGVSQFFHFDDYYYRDGGKFRGRSWHWPMTGQINVQGEFGVHKYLGLGFTTGVGGRGRINDNYKGEFNIPIGMIFNFHFYQLIADKKSKAKHADKLDMYFGANAGSGIAVSYYNDLRRARPIGFGGLQFGLRYYFNDKVGINGEFGFGKSLANIGLVFKL